MILGIDPGSRVTGYGVISHEKKRIIPIDFGTWPLKGEMPQRLALLQNHLLALCHAHPITAIALEQSFVHLNVAAALKLGQVRGVVMATSAQQGIMLSEYAARQVKQAVVGTGAATKAQVQHMVVQLLSLDAPPAHDAADALALAIAHSHWPEASTSKRTGKGSKASTRKLWTKYDSSSKR